MSKTHLTVSYRTVTLILLAIAVVGVVLTIFALRDAYDRVGGDATATLILTIAVIIASLSSIGAIVCMIVIDRQRRRR